MRMQNYLILRLVLFAAIQLYITFLGCHPVYNIGSDFDGLDKQYAKTVTHKYIFQQFVNKSDLFPQSDHKIQIPDKDDNGNVVLYYCYQPSYIRLAYSKTNKTIWKTSKLTTRYKPHEFYDTVNPDSRDEEIVFIDNFDLHDGNFILWDAKTKQYVIKNINGSEIRLPLEISSMHYTSSFYGIEQRNLLAFSLYNPIDEYFKKADTVLIYDEIAIADRKGKLISKIHIQRCKQTENVYLDNYFEKVLVQFQELNDEYYIDLYNSDGTFITRIGDTKPGSEIRFPTGHGIALMHADDFTGYKILDTNTSEILAEFVNCEYFDATSSDIGIAIAAVGSTIGVIDYKNGKLIQRLLDFSKDYDITWVKISQDGSQIWYSRHYPDKYSEILLSQIEM